MFRKAEIHEGVAYLVTDAGDLLRVRNRYGDHPLIEVLDRGVRDDDLAIKVAVASQRFQSL